MALSLDKFRDVDLVIDKANDNFIQRQFVSQGDYKGRTLTVQVTDNGVIGEVPGLTLNLRWHNQASGLTDLSPFECIDKANSIFRITYPNNMLNPGKVIASIQILHNGQVTHSKQFEITVQKLAGQAKGIITKSEYGALVQALADANKWRSELNSLWAIKADKTYVDSLISSIAQGGPKELFYSIAALKAKYPNGASGTYLVFDSSNMDGAHVFMWEDNSWTDMGEYGNFVSDGQMKKVVGDFDNFISNSTFADGLVEPMKMIGSSQTSIASARGNEWVRITDNGGDFSGFYYELDSNSDYFGFGMDVQSLKFSILPAISGTYYAQISYAIDATSPEFKFQNLKRMDLIAGQETEFACDFSLESVPESARPFYRIKIVHNKVEVEAKETNFLIRGMKLQNKLSVIYPNSSILVSTKTNPVPLENNTLTISDFLSSQFYIAQSTTTTGNVGVAWQVGNDSTRDYNHSNPYKITANVQNTGLDMVKIIVAWQGLATDGTLVASKTLDTFWLDKSQMYAIDTIFRLPKVYGYVQSRFLIYCENTGVEQLAIDKETTVIRLFKKINNQQSVIGDYVTNSRLSHSAILSGALLDVIHRDGYDWVRCSGTMTSDGALQGIIFPSTEYETIDRWNSITASFDIFSEFATNFSAKMLYVDKTSAVLKTDDVYYSLNLKPSEKRHIEIDYQVKSVPNAVQMWLVIGQTKAGPANFRIANVTVKTTCVRNDRLKYANGDFLKSYRVVGSDVNANHVQTRGANWLLVQSISGQFNPELQGVRFPIPIDRGLKGSKIKLPVDIVSLQDDTYEYYVQYIRADSTQEKMELIGDSDKGLNQLWHKEFVHRIDAASDSVMAYFVILHKGAVPVRFMVKDVNVEPYVELEEDQLRSTHLPIFNLIGDFTGMSGDVRKNLVVKHYQDGFSNMYYADCKWQGDSSLQWPKKNLRLRFFSDSAHKQKFKFGILPLDKDTNQINLKADWNDWTHANNVLISQYIADLTTATRKSLRSNLSDAYNQEQITGYPCLVYLNGAYYGLFTVSTKKGDDLMNSDEDNPLHAVIQAAENCDATKFKSDTALVDTTDFEMATPDELEPSILAKFNELLTLVNSADDATFKAQIASKINLQSVANWIVAVMYFRLRDNVYKNVCYQTTDGGETWYMVDYDHDQAYGMFWDRSIWYEYDHFQLRDMMDNHKLVQRLIELGMIDEQLKWAYQELSKIAPIHKIAGDYKTWINNIGSTAIEENFKRWPDQMGKKYFNLKMLFPWIAKRLTVVEEMFEQETLDSLKKQ